MKESDRIVREFHRLFYDDDAPAEERQGRHTLTRYHGHEAHQCPNDLWIFQELLWELRPALVIELGTYFGGTTLFLAHQLDLLSSGRVLSVDCIDRQAPDHPRITYVRGLTTAPEVLMEIEAAVNDCSGPVLVLHDADHRYEPALADLEAYAPFVTPGSYLIVADTNVNGHPVLESWGPGPYEAVVTFLDRHPEFEIDATREKFLLTYCPRGFLRRVT